MRKEITALTGEGNAGDKGVELHSFHCQAIVRGKKQHVF